MNHRGRLSLYADKERFILSICCLLCIYLSLRFSLTIGTIVVVIVWWLYLQLTVQSVPIAYHLLNSEFESCSWRDFVDTTLSDGVYQLLTSGLWLSPGIPVSSINKTDRLYITEIFIAPGVRHHTPCLFHVIYPWTVFNKR